MITVEASAPGKLILFGEHAVVYGQPALATPLSNLRATATVYEAPPGNGLIINATDLDLTLQLEEATNHGLALMAQAVLDVLGCKQRLMMQASPPLSY